MSENNKNNTKQINAIIYDKENVMETIKLLDSINVKGIEQCMIITNIAQRLNSIVKEERMNIETE